MVGAWVDEARRRRLVNVAVQSACAADETSVDGAFTSNYPQFQTGRQLCLEFDVSLIIF